MARLSPDAAAPDGHAAVGPPIGLRTFSSLQHRDFRFLWLGTVFSAGGIWVQQVTLGWLLYEMTGSAVLLGVLNAVRMVPFLFSTPIAGVMADRVDRRRLLLSIQPGLILATFAMGVVVFLGAVQVWHLFAFTAVTALLWSVNQPVRQTLIPTVVPRRDMMNAIALASMGFNTTKIIGPALGGLLILWFGAAGNFFVQAGAYLMVFLMVYSMRITGTRSVALDASVLANLKEGLRYVRSTPVVLGLMIAALVPNLFVVPVYQALMPVFQKDVLGVGPEGLGLLLAAPGVGAVVSTFVLASLAHRIRRKGLLLIAGIVLMGVSLVIFSRATSLPVAMLALAAVGTCQMMFSTTANTLLHHVVPDTLRGRVMSIYMLDHGLAPGGAVLAGVMTHFIGGPTTVAILGGVVVLLGILVAVRFPRVRTMES